MLISRGEMQLNMKVVNLDMDLKANCVSFDLFNTLVRREVFRDEDVFFLVELRYQKLYGKSIDGFAKARHNAERFLWKKTEKGKFSLSEIYKCLESLYEHETLENIKSVELAVEKEVIKINPEIKKLYDEQLKKCRVFITTDMYLEREQLVYILKELNISGYKDLLISGMQNASKASGKLFDILINIASREYTVHIGDSIKGDYLRPRQKGIDSFLYKPYFNPYFSLKKIKSVEDSVIYGMINAHAFDYEDYWKTIGFSILGPLLAGYVGWIYRMVIENHITDVLFLARDGYIVKKYFDLFYPSALNSKYMYISRKSAVKTIIKENDGIKDIICKYNFRKQETWENILKRLDIDISFTQKASGEEIIKREDLYAGKYNNRLEEFVPGIKKSADLQRNYLKQYVKSLTFGKRVAVVDVGWNGTIQDCLQTIMTNEIDFMGFYLGLESNSNLKKSYFSSKCFDKNVIPYTRGVFETFFSAAHNSTDKYDEDHGNVIPVFSECDISYETENVIELIQNGALEFGKMLKEKVEFYGLDLCNISRDFVSEGLIMFAISPLVGDAQLFGNIMFNDTSNRKLVNLDKDMDFKDKILNFWDSDWKAGFITEWFGKKAPYGKIFAFLNRFR